MFSVLALSLKKSYVQTKTKNSYLRANFRDRTVPNSPYLLVLKYPKGVRTQIRHPKVVQMEKLRNSVVFYSQRCYGIDDNGQHKCHKSSTPYDTKGTPQMADWPPLEASPPSPSQRNPGSVPDIVQVYPSVGNVIKRHSHTAMRVNILP